MDIRLWAVIVILACVVLGLSAKLFMMRRAAKEIAEKLAERLPSDTNTLIDISSHDRCMKKLAASLNVQLKKLRQERQCFQQGNIELKNAVTNISHDLRTPLTAINAYLDLLDHAEKSEAAERYIGIIKNRADALTQLTEELFRYFIIASSEYSAPTELLSVNSILEESILDFYAVLQERKITPDIHMTENKILRKLNRQALSRIFANLLSNAVKYSDGDLEISLTDDGKIFFSNTALGLSRTQVERLFDRFYTVETAGNSTGLGLSVSRTLTEQMHGTISAQYEKNRLSICIQLPGK